VTGGAGALAIALAVVGACGGEPETHYGNPNTLKKSNLPGEAGIEPLACSGDAGASDAALQGDACAISWSKDIYPNMLGPDKWQCATSACHAPGKQVPAIDPQNAGAALTSLKAYKMSTKPNDTYIGTTGDPSKSTIECNLSGQCDPAMPIGAGKQLSNDERCRLHAWLQCGAPSN
jgi:hypothetical protein